MAESWAAMKAVQKVASKEVTWVACSAECSAANWADQKAGLKAVRTVVTMAANWAATMAALKAVTTVATMAANWVEMTVAMMAVSLVAWRVVEKAASWELMWAVCSAVRWAG